MLETMRYAEGTELRVSRPWGLYQGGKALCSDGKIRALKRISVTADTFFSVPASVRVNGKTVAGYITFDTVGDNARPTVLFKAYTYRKNGHLLP